MKLRDSRFYLAALLMSVFVFSLVSCSSKKPVKPPEPIVEQPQVQEEIPPADIPVDENVISDKNFQSIPEIVTVNFEYDRFDLSEDAKRKLQGNVDFLKMNPQLEILVEGHCCECGTNEYNLALGQKRAKVVRDYYISLGIPVKKIGTISYGEEKPINVNAGPPDSQLCNANKRAETKVRRKNAGIAE